MGLLPIEAKVAAIGYLIRMQRSDPAPPPPDEQETINYGIGSCLSDLAASLADVRQAIEEHEMSAAKLRTPKARKRK